MILLPDSFLLTFKCTLVESTQIPQISVQLRIFKFFFIFQFRVNFSLLFYQVYQQHILDYFNGTLRKSDQISFWSIHFSCRMYVIITIKDSLLNHIVVFKLDPYMTNLPHQVSCLSSASKNILVNKFFEIQKMFFYLYSRTLRHNPFFRIHFQGNGLVCANFIGSTDLISIFEKKNIITKIKDILLHEGQVLTPDYHLFLFHFSDNVNSFIPVPK